LKKIVLSIFAVSVLSAGWIEDNIIDVSTDSGYYETQTRGIYSLGSKTIKFKEVGGTITPFHMEPPRFNVGCGGIDISMGGFSYLKKEFIVEKLKAISAAAPAFVYQMAISALCKDCQNIMNELEKAANMINGLNFDTCDAINAAQGAGKFVGEAMNKTIFDGQSDSWTSAKLKTGRETMEGWGSSIKSFFGGDEAKAKEKMDAMVLTGSLIDMVTSKGLADVSKLDILGTDEWGDKQLLSIYRAVIGDVIGGKDSDGKPTTYIIPGGTTADLFEVLFEGGKSQTISYSRTDKRIINGGETTITGTKEYISNAIKGVYEKMKNKQALDSADKKFLSSLSIPIYKFLNIAVISKTGEFEINSLAEQVALNQTIDLVLYMSKIISRGVSYYVAVNGKDMSPELQAEASNISTRLDALNAQAFEYKADAAIEFQGHITLLKYIKEREQDVKTKLSTYPFYNSMR
jgi:conjugative transfer pilus assembly protein TraH